MAVWVVQGYSLELLFPNCFELQQLLKGLFFFPHHNHLGSFERDPYTQLSIRHSVLTDITEERQTASKKSEKTRCYVSNTIQILFETT